MKSAGFWGVIGASLVASVLGEVHHLADDTFDAHVAQYKYVLAEFYAPWCGHCKKLEPEYKKAAEHFESMEVEGGLSLVAVDATEHKELATKFGVQGFPTLKWIVNGEETDYTGGRTKDDIVSWITKKTGPPAEKVDDEAAFEAFKDKADVVVLGWFASEDSAAAKEFIAAAETDEEALYGISTDASVKSAAGVSGDSVVIFRKFEAPDEPRLECEGDLTKDNIKKCVSGNLLPLIVPFSQSNAQKIFGGAVKKHVLIFIESADASADTLAQARPIASKYKGEYLFVSVSKSDDRILEFFGVTVDDLPTARIVEMGEQMKKFKLEGSFSQDNLEKFVASHSNGEISPDLKSEDSADDDMTGALWILKGNTHDDVVFDPSKNVFVKYYAPWCGHCKKMAPDWDKLSEHYAGDDDIVIAKFDATANEVESVPVQGFPTLKFFPKGSSDASGMVDFDQGRDLESFKKFVEENRG